jgi:CRISPR type III-A-associated RAMP protein Csm5
VVVDCFRKIPIRLECIAKDISTEFELTLENYQWEDLAYEANTYAFDALSAELNLTKNDTKTTIYYSQIDKLQQAISDASENTAYLRIGFGKGYYLNSLGIAIYDYVSQKGKENLYDKFEFFLKGEFAKRGGENDFSLEKFPRTRLMVKKTQEPLGWIKIEKM